MGWPFRRSTVWQISQALRELGARSPGDPGAHRGRAELRSILDSASPRFAKWIGRLLTATAAALLVWDPLSLGRGGNGSFALVMTSTLQGYRGRLDDRRFPSGRTLAEAGLSLLGSEALGLPSAIPVASDDSRASQVLGGHRHGRKVRSGIHNLPGGRALVRTGISSEPPCFSCEIVEGHLLSTSSPMALDGAFLSGRTGPGRIGIANDGSWLVVDRVLPPNYKGRRAMLLLRQLRDIALAEKLVPDPSSRRRALV